ncbi:MAG TPA: aromatic amino acid transport family protein [Coxiellaceae bacterium]|nr:aromatic amino acid transport family protein [Coxiellaceae bacterium]
MVFHRFIGAVLLIIGTSIGGGILALPLVTSLGGFWHSSFLLIGVWFLMTLGAFFVLEITLWLPEDSNMVSMARHTLGKIGQGITWIVYLLLLYTLLSAFMAGGTNLLANVLALISINFPHWVDSLLFLVLLGSIVADGIRSVDWANRGLMTVKFGSYLLLVILLMPHIQMPLLPKGSWHAVLPAVMPVITSFGFAIVMPSLRGYLMNNVKLLRLSLVIGSLIPLLCYLVWDFVVQGTVSSEGQGGLAAMVQAPDAVAQLTNALSDSLNNSWISTIVHVFTAICITTSFLGVSLSLNDFLADGLQVTKKGGGRWICLALTYIPPLIVILLYPGAFIKAISYAGIFVVILLMLLPGLMFWAGVRHQPQYSILWKRLAALEILVSLALTVFGIIQTL